MQIFRAALSLASLKLYTYMHKVTHFPNTADSDLSLHARYHPLATVKGATALCKKPARIRVSVRADVHIWGSRLAS